MKTNEELAMETYKKFGGSHFHMEREGVYKSYKKYNISKDQEKKWDDEYINELIAGIKNKIIADEEYIKLLIALDRTVNTYFISIFIEIFKTNVNKMDTFSVLLISECTIKILNSLILSCDKEKTKIALDFIKSIKLVLLNVADSTVVISPYFKNINHLKGMLSDKKIKLRITDALNEINNL